MPWNYVNRSRNLVIELPPVSGLSLAAWLDASDTSSMVVDGNQVTRWKDKISNKWFEQTDPTIQPRLVNTVFPVPVVDFTYSGVGKWMKLEGGQTISAPAPTEAYIVHYWTGAPSSYASWAIFNGTAFNAVQGGVGRPYYLIYKTPALAYAYQYAQTGTAYYTSTVAPTVPGKNIATLYSAPTAAESWVYRNGVSMIKTSGGGVFTTTDVFTSIGSSDTLYRSAGAVAELLIYNRTLTPEERAETVAYLTAKWGTMTP